MANAGAVRAGAAFVEVFLDKNPLVRGLRACEKSLSSRGKSVSSLGQKAMLAGGSIVGALVGASVKAASMGHDLAVMAQKTGVSVETLSALGYAAGQSGVSLESLGKGFKFMQKNLFAAGTGTKQAAQAIGQLGLTVGQLKGMSPEEQFKTLAEKIGQLKDPAARTAMAMKIFGRAGQDLLPMFELGKAGIAAMIQRARELGLIMSTEDAEAASTFHKKLKELKDVMTMGLFRIGSAIIPILQDLAEKFVRIAAKCAEWIKTNKGVVVMALYLGAALAVAGAAFMIVGKAMVFAGSMLKIVLTALSALKTVLLAIISPVGLIVAALAAGVGAFLYFSGYGAQLLDWLGGKFGELKEDATRAFNGISQALAKGDIGLAAQILWLTLKMEFLKGKYALLEIWLSFKNKFLEYWNGIGYAMILVWDTAVCGIKIAWSETVAFLKSIWIGFKEIYGNVVDWMVDKLMDVWIWWEKLLHPEFDEKGAREQATKMLAQDKTDRTNQTNADLLAVDKQRAANNAAATNEYNKNVNDIAQSYANDIQKNDDEKASRLAKVQEELAKAKAEWQKSLDEAAKPDDKTKPPPPKPPAFGDIASVSGATAIGTFSAAGLSQLGAGGVMQKIATASQETADNTAEIADNTADGGEEFAP